MVRGRRYKTSLFVGEYRAKVVGCRSGLCAEGERVRHLKQWISRQGFREVRASPIEGVVGEVGR